MHQAEEGIAPMLGIIMEFDFRAKYRMLEVKRQPAYKRPGAQACVRCGLCCWKRPPRLTRDNLVAAANALRLGPEEFFKAYCVVDNPSGTLAPVLRRADQARFGGLWLPPAETYSMSSPCVFLDDLHPQACGCKLQGDKPLECRQHLCWVADNTVHVEAWAPAEIAALGWDGDMGSDGDCDD